MMYPSPHIDNQFNYKQSINFKIVRVMQENWEEEIVPPKTGAQFWTDYFDA